MEPPNTIINMHGYIQREIHTRLLADLSLFPAVALSGPRQAGKSTLAKVQCAPVTVTDLLNLKAELQCLFS